jgi:FdrA protein
VRDFVEVRHGAYHDSVTLMRVSRRLSERPEVVAALTAMGTELNVELMRQEGFAVPAQAGPNDLVVAIRAADEAAVEQARHMLGELLSEGAALPAGGLGEPAPARTTAAAAARLDARLALVSVPGRYAFTEAMDALDAGLNVMVFSDNMPLAQEVMLKEAAARRGLIVMGPDCGTAVICGAGVGFANAVRPGPVGIVAASGTGAQQLMCLLDEAGVGVSHVLGVGGRDLSAEVSGRSTLAALAALDADPATELIVVAAKPPAPRVADLIHAAARRLDTPVRFALLGDDAPDLTTAAETVLASLGHEVPDWPCWPAPRARAVRGGLHGLFAGGTLCTEATFIAEQVLGGARNGHLLIDCGADEYTRGRAHPMIDPTVRLDRLAAAVADPACTVLLLDVVLGYGAEPDPAALLAPAIEAALSGRADLAVVVSLCGTRADPQDRDRQAAALQAAGAAVFASNAAAARHAAALAAGKAMS